MHKIANLFRKATSRSYLLDVQDDVGSGPVVIFLHGIASSSQNWRDLLPVLQQQYRCITIDLLGFGASPKPQDADYSIEQHIRSIRRTILSLKLRKPYIIVGHSLGSLLACRYARQYSKEVERLIMLSPPIYLHHSHYGRKRIKQTTGAYMRAYKFFRTHKRFALTNIARLAKISPRFAQFQLNEETWTPFVRSLQNCIETQTTITDIAEIKAPIDLMYGTRDQIIALDNIKLLGSMRHITLHELKGVNHFMSKRYITAITELLT